MVKIDEIRRIMKEKGISIEEVAQSLDMNKSTFYRKINQEGSTFSVAQAVQLAKVLKIDRKTVEDIFFSELLA